jgi:hypothetical protein
MAKKIDPRIRPIIAAGEDLAGGPRWQSALARATGVTQQHLAMLANGKRNLTPIIEKKIAEGLIKTSKEMTGRAERIGAMGHLILRKMKPKEGK